MTTLGLSNKGSLKILIATGVKAMLAGLEQRTPHRPFAGQPVKHYASLNPELVLCQYVKPKLVDTAMKGLGLSGSGAN